MTKQNDIPEYYKGKNGYRAKDVVSNFDLDYNIGTAVTYLLRAGKKDFNPAHEDIKKAMDHLQFELDLLVGLNITKTEKC